MSKKAMPYLLIISMVFLSVATSAIAKEAEKPKYSGFLRDYSMLQPDPDGSGAMRYLNPGNSMNKYNKIMLEKIVISLKSDAEYKAIDPDEMKMLTDYFREAIKKELGTDYPLVSEAGPGVMRVRIAITDLVPTKAIVSVVFLLAPFGTAADLALGGATKGSPPYLGHSAVEVEGMDSQTLEPVFSYVDQRFGKKFDTENPGAYVDAYSTWAYAQKNFDYWAKKFRTRMDEAHGKKVEEKKK